MTHTKQVHSTTQREREREREKEFPSPAWRRYLVQFAAQLGQPVALLQGPGAGPLALLGQGAGELFVLRPLFLQLVGEPPLLFLQAADLASLKLQLRPGKKKVFGRSEQPAAPREVNSRGCCWPSSLAVMQILHYFLQCNEVGFIAEAAKVFKVCT